MEAVDQKIQDIQLKLKKLLVKQEQQKMDIQVLKEENEQLRLQINQTNNEERRRSSELDVKGESISDSRYATTISGMKSKMEKYIDEVDRCIALINNW